MPSIVCGLCWHRKTEVKKLHTGPPWWSWQSWGEWEGRDTNKYRWDGPVGAHGWDYRSRDLKDEEKSAKRKGKPRQAIGSMSQAWWWRTLTSRSKGAQCSWREWWGARRKGGQITEDLALLVKDFVLHLRGVIIVLVIHTKNMINFFHIVFFTEV